MKKEYIESRENEVKRLDRKSLPKFLGFMLLCMVVGFIGGYFVCGVGDTEAFSKGLSEVLFWFCPAALLVCVAGFAAYAYKKLAALSLMVKDWDGEDEECADGVIAGLSRVVRYSDFTLVIIFALFGVGSYVLKNAQAVALMLASVAVFAAGMVVIVLTQHRALTLEQLICPEKNGSLFAFNFTKKAIAGMDEAEKLQLYRAGYAAHRAVNKACMIAWIAAILIQFAFKCGALPVALVSVIWFADVYGFCAGQGRTDK